jgi:hypothetical protein
MPAKAGIHVLLDKIKDVDGRAQASEATPFFERLCPAMTECYSALMPLASMNFDQLPISLCNFFSSASAGM